MDISIAKVAVSAATYAIDRPYDYRVPEGMDPRPGMRVLVPFGQGNRHAEGLILSVAQGDAMARMKPLLALLDREPVLDAALLRLALWMRERCFCTVYDAARAMLPAGLLFSLHDRIAVKDGIAREEAYAAAGKSGHAAALLDLLYAAGGGAERGAVHAAFGASDPNPALRRLTEAGIISVETKAARGVGDKTVQVVSLAVAPAEALAAVSKRRGAAPLRYAVVELLATVGSAAVPDLCYYTGASAATVRGLAKSGLLRIDRRETLRRPDYGRLADAGPVTLNEEQQAAFEGIRALMEREEPSAALLWGVTGSGKTQVYLSLIAHALAHGKTAILLVPEIALTPQLLRIFAARFGGTVAVLHSSLRSGERYDEWKRIRAGDARVVIGTRSAVFAPLRDLGILILDEEQEPTYKSEQLPRYHARDIAKYRCVQERAVLLLGSATPAVESFYRAKTGVYHAFSIARRYNERSLPQVMIADLREELRAGNGGTVSLLLKSEIEKNLASGEQTILFINRRGNSPMVSCGECGEVPTCPRCSVRMTYHSANGRLMCHYCGHSQPMPSACPVCGGRLRLIGAGTQKVQQELEGLFPGVEVLRMDRDTTGASRSHEAILSRFEKRRIPILLGTQMVAKGLDFENVTLVGVLAADLSLFVDDYRAFERTFSLLTQVVGRAGRGGRTGRAVIQTFTPQNDVIECAAKQDYERFYASEIRLRLLRGAPPFAELFTLTVSGLSETGVASACLRVRAAMEQPALGLGARLLGPAPAPVVRVKDRYRYRLSVAGPDTAPLRRLLSGALTAFQEDKRNRGLSMTVDKNATD